MAGLWIGAVTLAIKSAGLKPLPGAPAFLSSDLWAYVPVTLVTLAAAVMLWRAIWPSHRSNPPEAAQNDVSNRPPRVPLLDDFTRRYIVIGSFTALTILFYTVMGAIFQQHH